MTTASLVVDTALSAAVTVFVGGVAFLVPFRLDRRAGRVAAHASAPLTLPQAAWAKPADAQAELAA